MTIDSGGTSVKSKSQYVKLPSPTETPPFIVFMNVDFPDPFGPIFFFNDTATTEIYTLSYTLSLHGRSSDLNMKLLHTMVRVKDLDQSVDFFTNKLGLRSEEHTSELQSHSEISYAVFCLT